MWKWKGWFMSKKYILLYQKRYCFSLVSDWENIYKIPFCIGLEKKNGKASEAQSLNVRLSLCWAGSVCWGSRQQKENKSCLKNYFSGHEILVSGYYPVYPLCSSVTFAMGSETLQHLSNDRKGNSNPRVTKSSTQAGLQNSVGRRKRSQKGDVNVAGWKEFPSPDHCSHSLAARKSWRVSAAMAHQPFPWTLPLILIHCESQSCSITQLWVPAEKPKQSLSYPTGTSNNSTRKTRAQENISCTNFCHDPSTN